jgi:superfamily II DNA or RNA helicase
MAEIVEITKSSLIEHLYEHMDEGDWLDGLDLYQAGYVSKLRSMDGMISANVASTERHQAEVRIKIHPAGSTIQWIECTCRKNRAHGLYCEHIGATMLHIDREKSSLFAKLDPKMPMKPPATAGRKRPPTATSTHPTATKQENPTQSLLKHMDGAIQGVSLVGKGPEIKIRVEVKPGHLTNYTLPLDEAAKFLLEHQSEKYLGHDVRALKIGSLVARPSTRILTAGELGDIDIDRMVAIDVQAANSKQKGKVKVPKPIVGVPFSAPIMVAYRTRGTNTYELRWTQFAALKPLSRHIGQNFIFVEDYGYIPYDTAAVSPAWKDLPTGRRLDGDDAAAACSEGFSEFSKDASLYLDPELMDGIVISNPTVTKVKILAGDDQWFSVNPMFETADGSISMVDILLEYRKGKRDYFRAGKKWLKVPDFVTQFAWQIDETNKSLKLDTVSLIRFKSAVGELDKFAGSKKLLDKLRDRTDFQVEVAPPSLEGSSLDLRSYQTEGYSWMWWLHKNGLSGLLADEMGLGKTHQAMALLSAINNSKKGAKFLVVCPTTVLDHWLDKIEAFSPKLLPIKYHGLKRHGLLADLGKGHHTVLTSYGVVMRDVKALGDTEWDVVILDEAHFVKNNDTATYRAVCNLKSKSRFCLSGTPMENHLGELKAVFDFLVPGYLGSDEYFRRKWINPISSGVSIGPENSLQKLIHPFKMRRTKELVLKDLPEKVEDIRHCNLSDEQQAMYKQTMDMKVLPLMNLVKDDNKAVPFLHVFAVLTLLKQICDHPSVLCGKDTWKDHQSGKFDLFKELIEEALASGHKVVVYSQYLEMLGIISAYLKDQNIMHEVLTGGTTNRGKVIERFQTNPECKVFCASLLAGGVGIDLTAANVVIHYDRWWNASKENQATDRVHRIGQNKNVQVLKLVTRNSLEERIDQLIRKKQALFEKFLDHDEEIFKTLSRGEIIELLG